MRHPVVKVVVTGVMILVMWLVVFKLAAPILEYFVYACGIVAIAVILFQAYRMYGEEYSESVGLVPALKRETSPVQSDALPPGETIILEWATECLRAGNSLEAGAKLERISSEYRAHPSVLAVRYEIYKQERRWHAALEVARAYSKAAPDKAFGWLEQAICLHEMKFTQRAVNTLLGVVDKFPRDPQVPYHVARFMSEMGRLEGGDGPDFLHSLDLGDGKV